MITETSTNIQTYIIWKVDREKGEAFLALNTETYPLYFKLETFPVAFGEDNANQWHKGIKELLAKFEVCRIAGNLDEMAWDVVNFIKNKQTNTVLRQQLICEYKAIYE